jgi:Mg2+ and Co2+ transporter CorA
MTIKEKTILERVEEKLDKLCEEIYGDGRNKGMFERLRSVEKTIMEVNNRPTNWYKNIKEILVFITLFIAAAGGLPKILELLK